MEDKNSSSTAAGVVAGLAVGGGGDSCAGSSPAPSARVTANSNADAVDDKDDGLSSIVGRTIDFLTMARGLKTTPRTGWVRQKAGPRIESVADHSWRISLMAMVAAASAAAGQSADAEGTDVAPLDADKCVRMALVHDLAEAVVGDITPEEFSGVPDGEKHRLELQAMQRMTDLLLPTPLLSGSSGDADGDDTNSSSSRKSSIGEEMLSLWKEYEAGETREARLVKDLDKLEMTLQALEYESDGRNEESLQGFFDSTRDKWRTDLGRRWGLEIEARRESRRHPKRPDANQHEGAVDGDDGEQKRAAATIKKQKTSDDE